MITLGRFTRVAKHLGELINQYLGTWSLLRLADPFDTWTASGVLVLSILALVSQEERKVISARIQDTLGP